MSDESDINLNENERFAFSNSGSANYYDNSGANVFVGGSFVPTPTIPVNNSNLPNRHPNFVGRKDEIQKITHALSSRAWIITMDGLGGVGKTTLALEAAHLCKEHSKEYPNIPNFTGYIWTSARDKPEFSLDDITREILHVLSPFENQNRKLDRNEQLSLAIRALSIEPRLLIIDNFETVKDERLHRFLRDQLPDPSKVLITSRHHIQTGEKVITVGGLDEETAVLLLTLEAERLQIPISTQDNPRLHFIAQKSFGIPLVLRWVMEMVFNGKSLEWVLESLEKATANDIFDYIFERSLSILDKETRSVFNSMSLLKNWADIDTVKALNPDMAAIQERISHLVSLSLVDDNRSLVKGNRRFQLPVFARYLAIKELNETEDKGSKNIESVLEYYYGQVEKLKHFDSNTSEYLDNEISNISGVVQTATSIGSAQLLDKSIELAKSIGQLDYHKGQILFGYLIKPTEQNQDKEQILRLINAIRNPYVVGMPVRSPMFFGRREIIDYIRRNFESTNLISPVISLIGARRIGKTSIMRHLYSQKSEKCIYVFVDLQALFGKDKSAQLLFEMVRRSKEYLEGFSDISSSLDAYEFEYDEFTKQPYELFRTYIEMVIKVLGNSRLVFMLDEFDYFFYRNEDNQNETEKLLSFFRSLVSKGLFGIITAGVTPLQKLPQSVAGSPFLNIAISMRVSSLNRDDAIELIQQPTYGLLNYSDSAIEHILDLSGKVPFLIQFICFNILNLCRDSGKLFVNVEMVDDATKELSQQYYFEYLWSQLSQGEKLVVAEGAMLTQTNKGLFTIKQIGENFNKKISVKELRTYLAQLIDNEILLVENGDEYLKFTTELFRRWVLAQTEHIDK